MHQRRCATSLPFAPGQVIYLLLALYFLWGRGNSSYTRGTNFDRRTSIYVGLLDLQPSGRRAQGRKTVLMRALRQASKGVRLAVLNPRRANDTYQESVIPMLQEMFAAIEANVSLTDLDVGAKARGTFHSAYDFDGFVIPGSVASANDTGTVEWVDNLASTVRTLHSQQRPMLGLCFGHQIISHALGGQVEKNAAHGMQAASCSFELTSVGAQILEGGGSIASLQYHHNDVVTRLPDCAVNLGGSAENPAHATAVYADATVSRLIGALASSEKPTAITFQAHPEFSTPTGKRVMKALLEDAEQTPPRSPEWLEERLATVDDPVTNTQALRMAWAATKTLWPAAFN